MKLRSLLKKIVDGRSKKSNDYQLLAVVEAGNAQAVKVRKGCVAIYVGEEAKRYEVPVEYLSFPPLQELVKQSLGDDLDNQIDGPLCVACTPKTFDQLLKLAEYF